MKQYMRDQEIIENLNTLIRILRDRISEIKEIYDDIEPVQEDIKLLNRNIDRLSNCKGYFESVSRCIKCI
jgi:uncharacterized protein (UPF0305 family)